MEQIKSAKARAHLHSHSWKERETCPIENVRIYVAEQAVILAETEAYEQLEALKQKAVDRASITMGAMILDGYEPEDSCVKYVQELIEELKGLNGQ